MARFKGLKSWSSIDAQRPLRGGIARIDIFAFATNNDGQNGTADDLVVRFRS